MAVGDSTDPLYLSIKATEAVASGNTLKATLVAFIDVALAAGLYLRWKLEKEKRLADAAAGLKEEIPPAGTSGSLGSGTS